MNIDMDMAIRFFKQDPTPFEEEVFRFTYLMLKVAKLIKIRRCNACLPLEGSTMGDLCESINREQWYDVMIKVRSFDWEESIPEVKEGTFEPLEHAWCHAMVVVRDVLELVRKWTEEEAAVNGNLADKEELDVPSKTEGLKNKDTTDPGEAGIEEEKLVLSKTELHKTQGLTPSKGDDGVKKLKAKAIRADEAEAIQRMNEAKIRVDELLPESYSDW